jgi:hypothetical protein
MDILKNAFRWSFFHHNLKSAWFKLQKKIIGSYLESDMIRSGYGKFQIKA